MTETDKSEELPVEARIVRDDVRQGFKPLRNGLAKGTIEGHDYRITEAGEILVEFEDVAVEYPFSGLLVAAYRAAFDYPATREVIAECADCGTEIRHGEWHVGPLSSLLSGADGARGIHSVEVGEVAEDDRLCAPCSDRPIEDFPDSKPVAGVDE